MKSNPYMLCDELRRGAFHIMSASQSQTRNKAQSNGHNGAATIAPSDEDAALYITDLVLELRNLAKGLGLRPVQAFLELAFYEAYVAAHQTRVPDGEIDRLRAMGEDARQAEERLAKQA